jgi:hypothetical protein
MAGSLVPKWVKQEICNVWQAEAWKLMLLSNVHDSNAGTQRYISDVSANEISDTGGIYVAGGPTIAPGSKSVQPDGNNYYLDVGDLSIGPGSNLNYRYAVAYKNTGNPATSPIRAQVDFLTDQIVTNGTSTIQWNALGLLYVQ